MDVQERLKAWINLVQNQQGLATTLEDAMIEIAHLKALLERAKSDIYKSRSDLAGDGWETCDCCHCEISATLLADIDEVLK